MFLLGSPSKLYLLLFLIVIAAYIGYYASKSLKKNAEHFSELLREEDEKEKEESKEAKKAENDNYKDESNTSENENDITSNNAISEKQEIPECQKYNLRQEVMNIFDLYLGRKPNLEEINTYAAKGNEQDILTSIIQDFNISVTEADDNKVRKLSEMRTDACKPKSENVQKVKESVPLSTSSLKSNTTASSTITKEEMTNEKSEMVCIPKDLFVKLRNDFRDIDSFAKF